MMMLGVIVDSRCDKRADNDYVISYDMTRGGAERIAYNHGALSWGKALWFHVPMVLKAVS